MLTGGISRNQLFTTKLRQNIHFPTDCCDLFIPNLPSDTIAYQPTNIGEPNSKNFSVAGYSWCELEVGSRQPTVLISLRVPLQSKNPHYHNSMNKKITA